MFVDGAVGPEVDQALAIRRAHDSAVVAGPQLGNANLHAAPVNHAAVDVRSPQQFVSHPRLDLTLADGVVGGDAAPALPGRVAPISWDGEPGARSPMVVPS